MERRMSHDETIEVAVATKKVQLNKDRMSQFGRVMVTLRGLRTAGDCRALPEACDEVQEAFIARSPAMWMDPLEERKARVEVLLKVLEVPMAAGIDPEAAKRLSQVVLEIRVGTFKRALTGESAAEVVPLRIKFKPDDAMECVRVRPCQITPEKMKGLESQM